LTAYIHRTYIGPWRRPGSSGTIGRTPRISASVGSPSRKPGPFADEYARLLDDPDHSGDEERFILLGLSAAFGVLVVVHTYRAHDDIIRIISARKATKVERQQYDARWHR